MQSEVKVIVNIEWNLYIYEVKNKIESMTLFGLVWREAESGKCVLKHAEDNNIVLKGAMNNYIYKLYSSWETKSQQLIAQQIEMKTRLEVEEILGNFQSR